MNLTAVSANRRLGKALDRTTAFRRRLTDLVAPLAHPDWEILQVVMHDEPETHVEVRHVSRGSVGRRRQVGVGVPEGLTFQPADDPRFVDACALQLRRAIQRVKMADALRVSLLSCVEQARTECRKQSNAHSPLSVKYRSPDR